MLGINDKYILRSKTMWQTTIYFFLFSCSFSERTQDLYISFVADTLKEILFEFNQTDHIRQKSHHTPAFEVGFIIRQMEECYRRMVDIFNSTLTTDLYGWGGKTTDHIMFLKHVEILYWVLDHLANMLHETEKKYKLKIAGIFQKNIDWTIRTRSTTKFRGFVSQAIVTMRSTTKRPKQTWWPLDYGWEMNYEWR